MKQMPKLESMLMLRFGRANLNIFDTQRVFFLAKERSNAKARKAVKISEA